MLLLNPRGPVLDSEGLARRCLAEQAASAWPSYESAVLQRLEDELRARCFEAALEDRVEVNFYVGNALGDLLEFTSGHDVDLNRAKVGRELPPGVWWFHLHGPGYKGKLSNLVPKDAIRAHFYARFHDRLQGLGLDVLKHNPEGSCLTVSWRRPPQPSLKRARTFRGSLEAECGTCGSRSVLTVMTTSGQLICYSCVARAVHSNRLLQGGPPEMLERGGVAGDVEMASSRSRPSSRRSLSAEACVAAMLAESPWPRSSSW